MLANLPTVIPGDPVDTDGLCAVDEQRDVLIATLSQIRISDLISPLPGFGPDIQNPTITSL
jgi:hypothetical protein